MKLNNKYKFSLLFCSFFFILACSETTFLINSAKKISKWDEIQCIKLEIPTKSMENGTIQQLIMITMKWELHHGMDLVFTEKKTANGEIFDQNKISAAHRTLPMPSIVRVTNLDNGKVLENIRVNDRGPFAGNRIIDLSKKAEELRFCKFWCSKSKVEIMENESRIYAAQNSEKNKLEKLTKQK